MMLHVIKFLNKEEIDKYGDSYLINIQNENGVDNPLVYAYSPKGECYIRRNWNSVQFTYFLDEKGHKYDKFLKRIKEK